MRFFRFLTHVSLSAALSAGMFLAGPLVVVLTGGAAETPRFESVAVAEPPPVVFLPPPAEAGGDDEEAADAPAEEEGGNEGEDDVDADGPDVAGEGAAGDRRIRRGMRLDRPGTSASDVAERKRRRRCLDPVPQIADLGPDRYVVERDFVEDHVRDLKKLNSLGRVYRHRGDDGKVDGFQVRHIRCGNPLHQGGLRNGDVVHTVNGKNVRTIVQAIAVYHKVKNKNVVKVEITRQGERKRLTYRMR